MLVQSSAGGEKRENTEGRLAAEAGADWLRQQAQPVWGTVPMVQSG